MNQSDDSDSRITAMLQDRPCVMDQAVQHAIQEATGESAEMMIGMYHKYWQPFGLLLTDMEKEGMSVNRSASYYSCINT